MKLLKRLFKRQVSVDGYSGEPNDYNNDPNDSSVIGDSDMGQKDIKECADLCTKDTNCGAFVYNSDDKKCFLRNHNFDKNTPVKHGTGLKNYTYIKNSHKQENEGSFVLNDLYRDYYNSSLESIIPNPKTPDNPGYVNSTITYCARLCKDKEECKAFVFSKTSDEFGTCYLRDKYYSLNEGIPINSTFTNDGKDKFGNPNKLYEKKSNLPQSNGFDADQN